MGDQDPLRFNLEYEIIRSNRDRAYVVPRTEWLRLIERLERAKAASSFYNSAAWALLGIAATIFAGGFTVQELPWRVATWALGIGFLLCGLFNLHFARKHDGDRNSLLESVVDDMRAKAGADPEDTAGIRRTYRSVAYLRNYLREAFINQAPFTDNVAKYEVHSNKDTFQLVINDQAGRYLTTTVDVAPDWPAGESWSYAIKLGRALLDQLPQDLLSLTPDQWTGGHHQGSQLPG